MFCCPRISILRGSLKSCSSGLALNPRRSKSREPKRPKAAKVFERKHRNGVLTPSRYQMNEFTAKNEQAFLDACGAIGVEPNAMIEPHKERYPGVGILKRSSVVAEN